MKFSEEEQRLIEKAKAPKIRQLSSPILWVIGTLIVVSAAFVIFTESFVRSLSVIIVFCSIFLMMVAIGLAKENRMLHTIIREYSQLGDSEAS